MTSDKDPSRGENQIEAKELKEVELAWQPKEKSRGELQRQTKKEEEDIIFIHAATTEDPRRRFVFDNIQTAPPLYICIMCDARMYELYDACVHDL